MVVIAVRHRMCASLSREDVALSSAIIAPPHPSITGPALMTIHEQDLEFPVWAHSKCCAWCPVGSVTSQAHKSKGRVRVPFHRTTWLRSCGWVQPAHSHEHGRSAWQVIRWCAGRNVVSIPGCTSPTELYAAYRVGVAGVPPRPSHSDGL